MKNLNKDRYEILAFLQLVAFFTIALYLNVVEPENELVRILLFLSLVADGILLYFVLRKLWRTKWKTKAFESFQKLIAKIARTLMNFLEKWNIRRDKDQNVLLGKTTVSFDFSLSKMSEPKSKRALKWKHLQTDRERLRYLYVQMITNKINSGFTIKASDTPAELKEQYQFNEAEAELLDMYIDFRYDERKDLVNNKLLMLKKKI